MSFADPESFGFVAVVPVVVIAVVLEKVVDW